MHLIETKFDDFDHFKEFAVGWDLDFKLLSKNNFNAYLNIYSNDTFQLARTKLRGTIHQKGLVPKGFRSIVLPGNKGVKYNWLNKDVHSGQLLVFPRNGTLESVSFDNFDVYVISIHEAKLFELIECYGFRNAERVFVKNEKYLNLEASFLYGFWKDVEMFLNYAKMTVYDQSFQSKQFEAKMLDHVIYKVLKYLDSFNEILSFKKPRRRDIALAKSIEYIRNNKSRLVSVKELCKESKISERTLEYAFLEKYKVGPNSYIKAHQLNLVKNELVKFKGRKVRVSDVAVKFGFHHLGQFSIDFKKQFGYSPSKIR
ncbi:helix-turn-helix domain-containing protein [Lutimonas saemankumensis]|uniref:helix-turn-helix domain-containing protein n=1 Tax=Lutimonas saemankumensis TaxID=483016 RepID=UPI001CD30769|nr:helix-turn-helix domain-containing protein [Lutimonas saemankumensis]MCA0932970.1 helix-turn-helix domain-containing protein [Lutimonas saemankumensis]